MYLSVKLNGGDYDITIDQEALDAVDKIIDRELNVELTEEERESARKLVILAAIQHEESSEE